MKKALKVLICCLMASPVSFAQQVKTATTPPAEVTTSANVEIIELDEAAFKKNVWDFEKDAAMKRVGNLPVIIDFHATWCRPCKMLAPHLQAIQNKYKGKLIVYKVDVDKSPAVARKFGVRAMPTIVFIDTKTTYKSEVGYRELNDMEALVKSNFFTK